MPDYGRAALGKIASLLSEFTERGINVKWFGAKGDWDGTTGTDDTKAFEDAINAADLSGNKVYVPFGYYLASINITDQNVHLVGEGTLVHQKKKNVIKVKRTLGPSISVTNIDKVQIGVNNPAIGVPTETSTKLTISGSMVGIEQGDVYHISSQDVYPFCTQMTANKGTTIQVWKAGFVPVHGIGLNYTGVVNGGFVENDVVTGVTSGASGLILSKTDSLIVFGKISGDFVDGETLQVNSVNKGVVSGKAYIIMSGKLIDSYTTSPVIRKVNTKKKFIIDGLSIKASGDVDEIIGAANRLPAFQLMGVVNPKVKNFTIKSAWTRCFQLISCYGGDLDIHIEKLPDNANEIESAYGYGVELGGATEGTKTRVNGGNCRHAFTTNVYWGGFQYMDALINGTVKYNTVYDSLIKDALSASFDTHEGAYFTTFENCKSINSRSGLRNITASGGFQNRGFGTTYKDCVDNGSVIGFIEGGSMYEAGFIHTISYQDCIANDYQQYGFQHAANSPSNNAHIEFNDCNARGDGSAVNTPYYQAGFYLRSAIINLKRCSSSRFNGTPFQIAVTGSGRFNMIDCEADYFDAPAFTAGLRFDGAPSEFNLQNYKVRTSPFATSSPSGLIRVASGNVVINADNISCVNTATPPPLADVTGGSFAINYRSLVNAIKPITTNGDASATLTPRNSTIVQVWNVPLTADRTVTLPVTSGLVINGDTFKIIRSANATGAFNLIVGTSLKTLNPGQMCEVTFNGTAWILTGFSSL